MTKLNKKPYLIRGIYDWCVDAIYTPYVVAKISLTSRIPESQTTSDEITLNISPTSIQRLIIDDNGISFTTRFKGKPYDIYLPINTIVGIYSKENGEGLFFDVEIDKLNDKSIPHKLAKSAKERKSHLTLVK